MRTPPQLGSYESSDRRLLNLLWARTADRSPASATTRPMTGQSVQAPPNQWCTAEYQSSVVGRKTKPTMGHSSDAKRPSNQWPYSQRMATASRGVRSAREKRRQGMARSNHQFPAPVPLAVFA